ncbi:MAG TPA: hypothetical protein VKA32_01500 [Gammaproteobacteria bacterium]|nr:hypothetical protein [Gammaproteobacteria bacterium]
MDIDINQLEALIGSEVRFRGRRLTVVEVLSERPALVLSETDGASGIQANQFGEAARRAPRTWTIPVRDSNGDVHPLLREFTLAR